MKKLLLVLAALALYQNWDRLQRHIDGTPPPAARGEVVLYATDWCGYCRQTRELLTEQGVPYTEYDIEKNPEGRRQYDALNGRGVPVLKVGDEVLYGFNRERILGMVK